MTVRMYIIKNREATGRRQNIEHVVRGVDFPDSFAGRLMQDDMFRGWIQENRVEHDAPYRGTELVWSMTYNMFQMVVWDEKEIIRVQPISEEEVVLAMHEEQY